MNVIFYLLITTYACGAGSDKTICTSVKAYPTVAQCTTTGQQLPAKHNDAPVFWRCGALDIEGDGKTVHVNVD